jgi:hypothetical protein
MDRGFGNETPHARAHAERGTPTRYLAVIDAGGSSITHLVPAETHRHGAGQSQASR